ncbi:hypothetical protein BDP27DRAFT_1447012 [Rhodocollybia butyracea]|uniref:DUF6534 domain-containing protein n=1 Tax=Rhodocollybia butyracea TaxID=206335 RepID=A0A9P5PQI7_9AGAR|nr:hypothetical protein BDP27DRAFT_1447012 [Rhodocollybia butyracea]
MDNVILSVGAVVVSGWMSFMSFGVVAAAGWHYFLTFGNDKLLYRTVVITCMLLSLGDTIISGLWCYQWTTINWGDFSALLLTPKEAIALLAFFPTTALIVQLWFACRIWMLSMRKNVWLPTMIALLAAVSWCIVLWMFAMLVKRHSLITADSNLVFPVGYAWLVGSILTDICVFGGLIYYTEIRSRREREYHILSPRSLVVLTYRLIQCNVLPLLAQIALVVLFKTNVGLYYMLCDMTIAKTYTFSLLISLNARAPILEAVSSNVIITQRSDTTPRRINMIDVRQDTLDPVAPWQSAGKTDCEYDIGKGSLQ